MYGIFFSQYPIECCFGGEIHAFICQPWHDLCRWHRSIRWAMANGKHLFSFLFLQFVRGYRSFRARSLIFQHLFSAHPSRPCSFRISRKTGYKWLSRYQQQGLSGLLNQSKAPNSCPHRTPEELNQRLLELKRQHPEWEARLLMQSRVFRRERSEAPLPLTAERVLCQPARSARMPRGLETEMQVFCFNVTTFQARPLVLTRYFRRYQFFLLFPNNFN